MSIVTLCRRLAALAVVSALGLTANAQSVTYMGPDGTPIQGPRCAAPMPTLDEAQAIEAQVAAFLDANPNAADRTGLVQIPVAFHVVHSTSGTGNVSDQMIADQMQVLNDGFADHGYEFLLATTTRTANNSWFTGCAGGAEFAMKSALAVDPATTLNIYTCGPTGGILGYSYLPSTFPEDDVRHGVVALHSSLPGGTAAPYNLGDTVTHEVGHFVGLYHTFDNGCNPGDFVDDTEAEASPFFGPCATRDTCPSDPGNDPVENFMDYSDDICMNHFTPGQKERADIQMATFKPTMYIKVPVELVAFNAVLDGSDVTLAWGTASETNNAGFEVQMRRDGQGAYSTVGYVEGHGTTTEARTYTYAVDGLEPGSYIFRLKQIDFDGQFAYHGNLEVAVGTPGQFVLMPAYPNPFNPEATVRFAVQESAPVTLTLHDVLGRQVATLYEGTPAANETLAVRVNGSGLPSGTYMIRLSGASYAATQTVTLLK